MKKVCIVTNYSGTTNYGALLQAYALNRVITEMNCNVENLYVADRSQSKKAKYLLLLKRMKVLEIIKQLCEDLPELRIRNEMLTRRKAVMDFRMKIPHTKRYNADCFDGLSEKFDVFIAGSDQIFRPDRKTNKLVDYYWLSMVDIDQCVKASYAASMGKESLDEELRPVARSYLKSFDFLSFREQLAADYFSSLTGRADPAVHVDPVFLINAEIWKKKEKEYSIHGKYLFVYMIHGGRMLMDSIVQFARINGLKIVIFPYMSYTWRAWESKAGDVRVFDATPEQFLYLLDNAEFVFTDSFHVTAFSIIFHKQMYVSRANQVAFSRIANILEMFHVSEVEIPVEGIAGGAYETGRQQDWNATDQAIKSQQIRSLEYLRKVISFSVADRGTEER